MAKVNQSYVGTLNGGTTIGIQLPILVNSGADGSYVIAANQIAWGESEFNNNKFGGTSQGLLSAIETAIANKTVDLSNYTTYSYVTSYAVNAAFNAVEAHENAYGHISADERAAWNAAKSSIDAFLDENAVSDNVVNTLKEIQEYIASDGAAADEMLGKITAAQTRADNAYEYAGNVSTVAYNAYSYASNVGAVADAAQTRADSAYTYASNVGAVADAAQTRADSAYTYASNVGAVADAAQTRADSAYEHAGNVYSYATTECASLSNRITELANQGIDTESVNGIISSYLSSSDLTTDITYNIVHTDVETTKFLTNFSYVRQNGTNDYTFQFTYYEFKMPTAADYWGEYEPSTTEPPVV